MQTLIRQARHLAQKIISYSCIGLVLACAGLWTKSADAAIHLTCSAATASNLNFGEAVDVLQGAPATTTGTLSYSCNSNTSGWVALCFNLADGSGASTPGTTYNPRQMARTSSPSNKLNYQIFQDSALTIPWGTTKASIINGPLVLKVPIKKDSNLGTVAMYASIAPGQSTALAGSYTSSFTSTIQTEFTWKEVNAGETVTPATCNSGVNVVGSFGFQVYATVANRCYVGTTDLNFGPVSSIKTTAVTGQTQIDMQCTNSSAYQIGLNNGNNSSGNNRYMKKTSGTDLVRYELYTDAGRTVRWGNTKDVDTLRNQPNTTGTGFSLPITVYAQAYPGASVTAGNYADTVTVTVYF